MKKQTQKSIPSLRQNMRALVITSLLTLAASFANAATLFTFDFPGSPTGSGVVTSQTSPTPPTGVTVTDFTRMDVNNSDAANVFNSTGWNSTSTIIESEYISFSISAATGYTVTLTDLAFLQRGSNTVGDKYDVRLFDGTLLHVSRDSDTVSTADTNETWDFTDLILDAGETASFRWYVFGDTQADGSGTPSSAGTFRLDNVVINGSVAAAIPEPSRALLLGLSSIGLIFRRRRQ